METLILILLVANILLMVVFWAHIFSNVDIQFNRLKEKVRDISSKQSDILGAVRTSSNKVKFKNEDVEKPKKWQLAIIDLDSGMKKVYTYKDCDFLYASGYIDVNDMNGEFLASHSLVNRQYDIIEIK